MCGRFTQHYSWQEIHEFLSVVGAPHNLQPRYNIAPTTLIDMVRHDAEGRRELVRGVRWGLIPNWWKKPLKDLPAAFNARVETVSEKPMFRGAYRSRRCIVPASGFFEWTGKKGEKQPHMFVAADGSPILALAGLWERWRNPETGEDILSCTVIVTEPTTWMLPYHDRMPVLLQQAEIDRWLSGKMQANELHPISETGLREWPIDRRINRSGEGDDDPMVLEPLESDLL
ncbi:SOS response-associated peptidase [uncultured Methylovirgula sp.]|uniref:SOS response-associated peptidase n=1 Tax=uncultured Methylovirgula sp. TaxID=1285960 RepID=UPI002631830D|nr:SOS response-associated peptidase [uncultured Methylovirgula sp.]